MKVRQNPLSLPALSVALVAVFTCGSVALAQSTEVEHPPAISGAALFFFVVLGFAFYVYLALAVQAIAIKTGTPNPWLAWIPFANLFLLLNVAGKPFWWFFLYLIPLVNVVIGVMVWMAVAEARGKPSWWGILVIVPLVNLAVPGLLAWS